MCNVCDRVTPTVLCPTCGAPPGKPCKTKTGEPVKHVHVTRHMKPTREVTRFIAPQYRD